MSILFVVCTKYEYLDHFNLVYKLHIQPFFENYYTSNLDLGCTVVLKRS